MIEIKALAKEDWKTFGAQLQELESVAEYPYGEDSFKLNHGDNYFAFFERLGKPLFHLALTENRVVACAAGILRTLKIEKKEVKAWYLCDLKVHPNFQGQGIPAKLFKQNFFSNYLKCRRGYAISMNSANGKNRVVKLLERFSLVPIRYAGKLNFYSFNQTQAQGFHQKLESKLGKVSYLSLKGKKDLIMKSTGQPLPLFHIQHGAMAAAGIETASEEGTYMICGFENSALDNLLSENFPVSATASILAHRLKPRDWNFVLTSDI
jgi:ribosomal protein S18 acetylase RimI-like enzyme